MQCNLCNKEVGDKIDRINLICRKCSDLIEESKMGIEWYCYNCKKTNFCGGYVCEHCGNPTRKQ